MHTADLSLPCAGQAQAVRRALQPEADDLPDGATCTLQVDGDVLRAHLQARDLAGMRAAINSVVRLADAATRSLAGPP
jgi:tRNA threonylcarbamoyladenosine modification (KEOPS) complex  Pcc1 subunit